MRDPRYDVLFESVKIGHRIQSRLIALGVKIITSHGVSSFDDENVTLSCVYSQQTRAINCANLLTVTSRQPNDSLYYSLQKLVSDGGMSTTINRIGDCDAPSIIATAVFAGHRYARELEEEIDSENPMRYDRVFFNEE